MANNGNADTVRTLRKRKNRRPVHVSFMKPEELRRVRSSVLKATQSALASLLESPGTGAPIATSTVCRWEMGILGVPLWAARRIRHLATLAHDVDSRKD